MNPVFSHPSSTRRRAKWLRAVLVLALAAPVVVPAQSSGGQLPELSESVSEGLEKLRPLLDAKDWDGALALLTGLAAKAKPDTFDMAFLSDTIGKIYLQKGEYAKAIRPMETALAISEKNPNFFRVSVVQDMIYFLAQIYYQEAASSKVPSVQLDGYKKANSYLEKWLARSTKPASDAAQQDAVLFHASLLYNLAVFNPEKVDHKALSAAEAEVERALRMSAHPKENLYALALAICQQQNPPDYVRAAEILELLVKKHPQKKDYWAQLAGVYLNLGQDKDEQKARENNIRAILAIERAQALGFMNTPKENYNLVGVYFNVGQFGQATELLHAGLRKGTIESEQKNWELLAYSYQQVDKPLQAIEALREATKHFPKAGQLDFQIGQIFYGLNKTSEAYDALQSAVKKGNLDKPAAVYGFLSYICFELTRFDEALAAANKALALPDSKSDNQLPRLKTAIEEAIREREAQRAAANTRA